MIGKAARKLRAIPLPDRLLAHAAEEERQGFSCPDWSGARKEFLATAALLREAAVALGASIDNVDTQPHSQDSEEKP